MKAAFLLSPSLLVWLPLAYATPQQQRMTRMFGQEQGAEG